MRARHRFCLGSSLLLVCIVGCDRSHPVEPVFRTEAAGATGPAVKAPSNANAVAVSHSQIDVSWRDNSSNESGFDVHRSTTGASGAFTLLTSTAAGVTSYSDVGLTPSTEYCYKLLAGVRDRRAGNRSKCLRRYLRRQVFPLQSTNPNGCR